MTVKFPKLDMPVSDTLRLSAEDKLWVVHNPNTFEPYFMMVETKEIYHGDDDDYWDYVSLAVRKGIKYKALKGNNV